MTIVKIRIADFRLLTTVVLAVLLGIGAVPAFGKQSIFYMAPDGSDHFDGLSQAKPFRSFFKAFRKMRPGDELVLLDGVYSDLNKNGGISYLGKYSDQVVSGISGGRKTVVRSLNRGKATIEGRLIVGRSFRKDHDIIIDGLTFEGGAQLYNTEYVQIKNSGFHGSFTIGTNDHNDGNNYNLVEDSWIWAEGERIIASNYRSDYNVWRRVVIRGDGCNRVECLGPGNPNVGITVYDSNHVSIQNVIVVDRVLGLGSPYADFAAAQHTPGKYLFGMNEWLGTISIRAPDSGYYMEPDSDGTIDSTIKISNAVSWKARYSGINITRSGTNNVLENITVVNSGYDGIRIGKRLTSGKLTNSISVNSGRYGVNSSYPSSSMNVFNSGEDNYYESRKKCLRSCFSFDPTRGGTTASLKYLLRIEAGSKLKQAGNDGKDIGANILFRYGEDGSRYGEEGYNRLTSVPLWPWENEELIKEQMCKNTDRGFCTNGNRKNGAKPVTLTSYIWELLGNPIPVSVYRMPENKPASGPK